MPLDKCTPIVHDSCPGKGFPAIVVIRLAFNLAGLRTVDEGKGKKNEVIGIPPRSVTVLHTFSKKTLIEILVNHTPTLDNMPSIDSTLNPLPSDHEFTFDKFKYENETHYQRSSPLLSRKLASS